MEKAQDELNFGEGENWLCVMFSSQGPTSLPCGEKEGGGVGIREGNKHTRENETTRDLN